MHPSRLGRFVRPAVDFLSLYFTVLPAPTRSPDMDLPRRSENVPALLDKFTSPELHLPERPQTAFSPAGPSSRLSSAKQAGLRRRPYLISSGLLLAFSLEICGCDPVKESSPSAKTLSSDNTRHEVTRVEPGLSFYDPVTTTEELAPAHLQVSERWVDSRTAPLEAKPLPWAIPESVYFVYKGRDRHEPRPRQPPVGTAFVLSVPDRSHSRFVRFLVTARHVVDPQWAQCAEGNPASIDVRFNRRAGGVGYEAIPLQTGSVRRFYTPSDSTADLAVIPLDHQVIANLDAYKFIDVPFHLLPTDAEIRLVRMEQPIITAGLSLTASGEPANYPVFDAGFISNMPAEAVGVQCGIAETPPKPLHVWFINAGMPQGVSGAPVYTFITRGNGAIKTPVLLGVQSVAWPDKGIAGITPASVLAELIQSTLYRSKLKLDFYKGTNP